VFQDKSIRIQYTRIGPDSQGKISERTFFYMIRCRKARNFGASFFA